jgi:hypothetical protein
VGSCSLRLDVDAKQGLRTIEVLKGEPGPSTLAYESSCEQREQSITLGTRPTREIVSPSEIGEAPCNEGITVHCESIGRVAAGPSEPRFGTLVHSALRDSIGDVEIIGQIVHGYGCILGATEEGVEAAQQSSKMLFGTLCSGALARPRVATGSSQSSFGLMIPVPGRNLRSGILGWRDLACGRFQDRRRFFKPQCSA